VTSSTTGTMTGAEYIARTLEAYGLTHAFVVPTILTKTLIAMDDLTSIQRVVPHSEIAAAYMADGYARATGRIGVVGAQNVGRANLAAGLQDPYLGSSPVLALTGGPLPSSLSRHFYQEIDALPMFRGVTKSSVHLESADRLAQVLHQAIRDATTGRPGPAHIEFEGHAGEPIEGAEREFDMYLDPRFGAVTPLRMRPDATLLSDAIAAITAAKRPIIVAGGGVKLSGAGAELRAFAERLAIPVATSMNAKELIPADHPLAVGVVGLYSRKSANRAVAEADLVIFIGSRTSSQVTLNWTVPVVGTPVVHIDTDPAELGRHYPRTTPVLGDARTTLSELLEAMHASGVSADRAAWTDRTRALVAEYYDEFAAELSSDAEPMRPERLVSELSAHLPADALVVADTGHAGMWTAGMLDLKAGQGYLRAAGSLGWGLPAAIGAQLAAPQRPVVLFTGDGGFWYHASELETAVRWKVPLIIVVNDNSSLNQEVRPYTKGYGGELRGKHHELWHFEEIDLAALAESFGATGIRVTKPSDLGAAIARATEIGGPVVIDAVSARDALAPLGFDPAA
jgi:acetolactate synthase-1/2/3 large subunit